MKGEYLQIRISEEEKEQMRLEAKRAGKSLSEWVLEQVVPKKSRTFQELIRQIGALDTEKKTYAYAELSDFLYSLGAKELLRVARFAPIAELNAVDQNLVAALVERRAQQCECEPPRWVQEAVPLRAPYFATSLSSLRLHLLKNAPLVFRRRNLFVDSSLGDRV